MRLLLEFLLLVILVFLGWRQPYRDQISTRFPSAKIEPSRLAMVTLEAHKANLAAEAPSGRQNAPTARDSQWMWQPGSLDQKKQK